MTNNTMTTGSTTWVAVGPAGAVGSIHREPDGFHVELFGRRSTGGVFPSLGSAKSAVHAAMGPLADRPEFRAH
ncbi:methyltransferase [Curtobacterium sp. 'Ferrero']|uniref:methyltransferase n=1 Tax=Curtobacterium sp. 'Ferrero' TaxID=2033654 RepID=UPI000BD5DE00|nr:methyltransferase [Curtobacterium sp. 'Ferrero']PCN47519.1 methyltransferase [Curtobacterium sp. 'Ferrero']